jgi:hypothetical protein
MGRGPSERTGGASRRTPVIRFAILPIQNRTLETDHQQANSGGRAATLCVARLNTRLDEQVRFAYNITNRKNGCNPYGVRDNNQ